MPKIPAIAPLAQPAASSGTPLFRVSRFAFRVSSPAFTMMELIVSVSILVIIILSVGVTFSGASKSVGDSQAIMEMLSNVRATQQLIGDDISGMDKSCFLVIRSQVDPTYVVTLSNKDVVHHFDQMSFVANGTFPNRTGAYDDVSPFADTTTANAAHVWWGQLVLESMNPPDSSYNVYGQSQSRQDIQLSLTQPPTGIYPSGLNIITKENEFALGRHATLLLSGASPSTQGVGYTSLAYTKTTNLLNFSAVDGSQPPNITSSRWDIAAQSSSQLMQEVALLLQPNGQQRSLRRE